MEQKTFTLELTLEEVLMLHDSLCVAKNELLDRSHNLVYSDSIRDLYHRQAESTIALKDKIWNLV